MNHYWLSCLNPLKHFNCPSHPLVNKQTLLLPPPPPPSIEEGGEAAEEEEGKASHPSARI